MFSLLEDIFKIKVSIKFQLMARKLLLILLGCIGDMIADQMRGVVNLLAASAYSA